MLTSLQGIDIVFSEGFSNRLLGNLEGVGIKTIDVDESYLKLVAENEQNRLVAFLNVNIVPKELEYLLMNMILGSYLDFLYKTKKLPSNFDFEQATKRIQLGDTTVDMSDGISHEVLFVNQIRELKEGWKVEAVKCRKLNW